MVIHSLLELKCSTQQKLLNVRITFVPAVFEGNTAGNRKSRNFSTQWQNLLTASQSANVLSLPAVCGGVKRI